MKHPFKQYCYDVDKLIVGVTKLSQFMKRLQSQAQTDPDSFEPNKYYGDGFEALIESLIRQFASDKRIYIRDYVPVIDDDLGVDGYGYGPNGEIHTVQIKARSNPLGVLTANRDHISNFVAHSHSKFGGESKVKWMTIFTTAKDLHEVTREMYNNEVRVLGGSELSRLIDGNEMFWTRFREELKFSS